MSEIEQLKAMIAALEARIPAPQINPIDQFIDHLSNDQRVICYLSNITPERYVKNSSEYRHFQETGELPAEWTASEGDKS